jgi:AcrR family transcriptional regulator
VSADERRTERRQRLVTACLDLVGEGGVSTVTAQAVAERAGLTRRYFYESFADRDAVLVEALDGMFSTLGGDIRTALRTAGDAPLDRARATIQLLIATMDDPRVARLYVEAPGHPALQVRREQAIRSYTRLLAEEVLGLGRDDPRTELAALILVAGGHIAVGDAEHLDQPHVLVIILPDHYATPNRLRSARRRRTVRTRCPISVSPADTPAVDFAISIPTVGPRLFASVRGCSVRGAYAPVRCGNVPLWRRCTTRPIRPV